MHAEAQKWRVSLQCWFYGVFTADLLSCASSAPGGLCVCVCLCVSAKERDFDLTAKLTTASEWCQNEANRVSFPVRVCILLHFSPEVNLN